MRVTVTTKTLSVLIAELRLVERENGSFTRSPGEPRAQALAEEIAARLKVIEAEVEDRYGNVALNEAFYGKES